MSNETVIEKFSANITANNCEGSSIIECVVMNEHEFSFNTDFHEDDAHVSVYHDDVIFDYDVRQDYDRSSYRVAFRNALFEAIKNKETSFSFEAEVVNAA